jgi:hypothetical protein
MQQSPSPPALTTKQETVVVNLCQCVFPRFPGSLEEGCSPKYETNDVQDLEEVQSLIEKNVSTEKLQPKGWDLMRHTNRALDVFKGVLVIFMTWAHVDLTLMNPALQYGAPTAHFVGNVASGLCFLGFMGAYGFSCDNAYLSDSKPRPMAQRLERVARSAMLPVVGAWVCSISWGYMCWKIPLTLDGLWQILDFRMSMGNGPDFLLCFTFCLLAMYPLRGVLNHELGHENAWRRGGCVAAMLLGPLALTKLWIQDCTGSRKYWGYILECTNREAYSPVLPALPHLFYFNIGVLACRWVRKVAAEIKDGRNIDTKNLAVQIGVALLVTGGLSRPLMSVWAMNYGNLMVMTPYGLVSRGFSDGPSVLWLVGNLFGVLSLLLTTTSVLYLGHSKALDSSSWFGFFVGGAMRFLLSELEHLGANVLLYLVVGDMMLAGMWRGATGQYPLDTQGCIFVVFGVTMATRFLHYLGASSRSPGVVSAG